MFGTGQFPKFKEEQFEVAGTEYNLIATAEIPVTNFYADEILDASQLPQNLSLTHHVFGPRRAYGKDTKGLFRQHQFYKVELS
ncbi:MAG: aminoacyl--tRNA ligase-related protein [Bdellovibrionales bacterium]